MIRIWFNHWFSTAYNIIQMLKEADREYYVIGTNENDFAVYKIVCDEWYEEPVLEDDAYVEFCLTFCRQHGIDVFVPRRHLVAISRRKSDFTRNGIQVLVDDYEKIEPLNSKSKAYEALKDIRSWHIPEYYVVRDTDSFLRAYERLSSQYKEVCFKFENDEGGQSFRLIDNQRKGYAALFKRQNTRMTLESVVEALSERKQFAPVMVMPYLSGDEISADCLATDRGRIIIPRRKGTARYERIEYDESIVKMCHDFFEKVPLQCPCNIQFKYLDGTACFLEVNTRMSGGIQLSCAAERINIPHIAVRQLLGESIPWSISGKERIVTHVEVAIDVENER